MFQDRKTELIVSWTVLLVLSLIILVGYLQFGEVPSTFERLVLAVGMIANIISTTGYLYNRKKSS